MLGHGHVRKISGGSSRSSNESLRQEEEETIVDEGDRNILLSIISQLRPGADLSRITFPTFILEPKSMLERITNFMQHPETLLPMPTIDDSTERFISVLRFYLSGWHLRPPGVKKPLNPILGEFYTCYWDYSDNTRGYYISEQTSHHPPKSSYFYMAPQHYIRIDGTLKPRSRFLGNSAASMMEGIAVLRFLNRGGPGGEKYLITQPNIYVRGILFGKMKYELGDHSYVKCPELDLIADVEFKTKGWVSGSYDAIGGYIKRESTGEHLYEISGKWTEDMWLKNLLTGKRESLFDATNAKPTPPQVRPLKEQEERESQKLWKKVTSALIKKDQQIATEEKSKIEDRQRDEARMREADGVEFTPRFFRPTSTGEEDHELDFILNKHLDGATPEDQERQILAITPILAGSKSSRRYDIPEYHRKERSERSGVSSILDAAHITNTTDKSDTKPTAILADLIDFGDCNDELGPALVPTTAGVASAGKMKGNENGDGKLNDGRSGFLPKPAGESSTLKSKNKNHLIIDDNNGEEHFASASQGSLI